MTVQKMTGVNTVSEAAQKARVSTWSIRQAIQRGELRARRIGRCLRILDDELDRWLHDYGESESRDR